MAGAMIALSKLLVVREIQEDEEGASLRFEHGSCGRLTLGDAKYSYYLRLARRSQERQHPVGVSFDGSHVITEVIRAENDVPTHIVEDAPDRARVTFQGHDGVFVLKLDHPESARILILLTEALRAKGRIWFLAQKPELALTDVILVSDRK